MYVGFGTIQVQVPHNNGISGLALISSQCVPRSITDCVRCQADLESLYGVRTFLGFRQLESGIVPAHTFKLSYDLTVVQNMANLIRSAKSGSDWTRAELDAYNISIIDEEVPTFFGLPVLPQPTVDQELLQIQDANLMADEKNAELINLLDLAMVPGSEESAVDDFAVVLFRTLGYLGRHRVARTRKDIPFLICGEWRHAKTDVCIVDRSQNDIMMLVQEDKRFSVTETATAEAEAQLVAEAIAAFSYNNEARRAAGLPVHASRVCLCGPRWLPRD